MGRAAGCAAGPGRQPAPGLRDAGRRAPAAPGLLGLLGIALLALAPAALRAAGPVYPDQPARGPELICVSDSGLSCFDAQTMDLDWRALRGNFTYEPVVTESAVLAGSTTGLHVQHAADGSPHWQWNSGRETASPVIRSGTVYAAGHGGRVAALDLADGGVQWTTTLEGAVYTPALLGGLVIAGRRTGVIEALDAASGATRWRRALDHALVGPPVALDNAVVVTTFGGSIISLGPTGEVLWQQQDPAPSFSPAGGAGMLVFGGLDGRLRARDPASGALRWRTALSGQLSIPARQRGGRIAVATPARKLVLIHADDGEVLARTPLPGTPLGRPLPLPAGGWRVFYRDAGEVSWVDAVPERAAAGSRLRADPVAPAGSPLPRADPEPAPRRRG